MRSLRALHADEAGQTVVIVALAFTVLLGFVGLAVDGGRFYAERRFLQTAVDAAALGCVQKLTVGGTQLQAEDQAKTILRTYNLPGDPTGTGVVVSDAPLTNTWFNTIAGDWRNLYDGVHAGTTDCRVAVQASMQTFFIRLFGIGQISVPANAHAVSKGGMYPVVVNRYKDPPGPSRSFIDYTKEEAFQNAYPNTCYENGGRVGGGTCPDAAAGDYSVDGSGNAVCSDCRWGPETVIAGQGYQSSDSDFRGFIALDVRDFSTSSSGASLYYNGVTVTTQTNTLKDQEAAYVNGGYPGPDLEEYVPGSNPVQAGLQIGVMSGNSSGVVVSNFDRYFQTGDKALIQLFDGQVREIPEYTINPPSSIDIPTIPYGPTTGTTFRVGANQRFRSAQDKVVLTMVRDTFDTSSNDTPTQLQDIHFDPGSEPSPPYAGRFTPDGGSGTQVRIRDLGVTSDASPGIYSVIIQGVGFNLLGGQLSTKKVRVPVNIGGVRSDFTMKFDATVSEIGQTDPGTFTFSLSTGPSAEAWGSGGAVTFTIDSTGCAPGSAAFVSSKPIDPIRCASATVSPNSATPDKNNPPTVTVTVPTGLPQGSYTLILRARGMNGENPSRPVVHVQSLTLAVGTAAAGAQSKYVNVQGYAVFVITSVTANTVNGRAISAYYANPNDPALNIAHKAGLIPWEVAPCGLPSCPY